MNRLNTTKRVFLIVLDSVGAGELPDAAEFGDNGANTLRSLSKSQRLFIPNLKDLGIGNIDGLGFLGANSSPKSAFCKLAELSRGKDSTIGHWEISGIISQKPLPVFPSGFPDSIIGEFSRQTGRGVICNKPYSGTKVIADYGEEHIKTGSLIVYTSADSVFQIAAHESVVPPEELYECCRIARDLLKGEFGVGRVIARPFVGDNPQNFTRTARRHDFSLEPPSGTVLDALKASGYDVIAVGKINDLFAGRGITKAVSTSGNADGMEKTMRLAHEDFNGLCFLNLVDFDTLYGHRNNTDGYAEALSEFDRWLGEFIPCLSEGDMLMITADHGCDPGYKGTDHTREYIPLLVYGGGINPCDLGVRRTFSDIAATLAEIFGVSYSCEGRSMLGELTDVKKLLCAKAARVRGFSHSPYSGYKVGAALLAGSGEIYTGCNIENSAFSPTICAERAAFAKAVSAGESEFSMIAIVGGKGDGEVEACYPCGVCRQVMSEFCNPDDFRIIIPNGDVYSQYTYSEYTLAQLMPHGFSM